MNTENDECVPIVKLMAAVTKRYVGVLRSKMKDADNIDKYYYALFMIGNAKESMNQNDLACAISQDKVSVVRIVDHLSAQNLITREVDDNDRRKYNLSLTEKGQKIYPIIRDALNETNKQCLSGLSEEQIENFVHYISIMQSNLDKLPAESVKMKFSASAGVRS